MLNNRQTSPHHDIEMLGDHLALNFLNTISLADGEPADSLKSDDDVLRWLKIMKVPVNSELPRWRPAALLQSARGLRDIIRACVERRVAGKRLDLAPLNTFLAETESYLQLIKQPNGQLKIVRNWRMRTPQQFLAPVAESVSELLALEDFSNVKQCESETCILWFFDRTKSHHRRWCSMATCGNRHKIAAFRQRKGTASVA
jgi:predicted RNA-binding Zn ribbon-like protein